MIQPGPRNLITDVDGIAVGNAEDAGARSGTTVVLPDRPAVGGVDVRGGTPGTRETNMMDPPCGVSTIDAVVRSGGSAFGLDAASGASDWLRAAGRGYPVGPVRVPIVPAAILFDLLNGGDTSWQTPPYRELGRAACEAAGADFALGNAGAGLGATAADLKGGLGSVSAVTEDGLQVGAVVAVNPAGSVVVPGSSSFWAWPYERNGELGGQKPPPVTELSAEHDFAGVARANTTIGVVATNAQLDKAQAGRLAIMAHDGLARAIRPIHTVFDGDAIFVLATGRCELPEPAQLSLTRLGGLAADCVTRAIARGVYLADDLGDIESYRTRYAGASAGG
jgi:L-aminopeptidase/D-esterase-like protein